MSKGPEQLKLERAVGEGISRSGDIRKAADEWKSAATDLDRAARDLELRSYTAMTLSPQTGKAMGDAFVRSSSGMAEKADLLTRGAAALERSATQLEEAEAARQQLRPLNDPGAAPTIDDPKSKQGIAQQSAYDTALGNYERDRQFNEDLARPHNTQMDETNRESTQVMKEIHGIPDPVQEPAGPGGGGTGGGGNTPTGSGGSTGGGGGSTGGGGGSTGGGGSSTDGGGGTGGEGEEPTTTGGGATGTPQTGATGSPTTTTGAPVTAPSSGSAGSNLGGIGAAAGAGLLGGAGGVAGGIRGGSAPVSAAGSTGNRAIGSTARSAASSTLGRSGAAGSTSRTAGTTARGAAGAGTSSGRGASGRGGSGARGGGRAAAAGAAGGRGTGGKGTAKGAGRSGTFGGAAGRSQKGDRDDAVTQDHLIDDQDWIDDEDAAPSVIS